MIDSGPHGPEFRYVRGGVCVETSSDVATERPHGGGPREDEHAMPNRVRQLETRGQSVWLDYLRRSLFTSGEFRRSLDEDGLRGATSNPSIFEKAIAGSTDYLYALQQIERSHDIEPMALYEAWRFGAPHKPRLSVTWRTMCSCSSAAARVSPWPTRAQECSARRGS
jgi:hypothetical protein